MSKKNEEKSQQAENQTEDAQKPEQGQVSDNEQTGLEKGKDSGKAESGKEGQKTPAPAIGEEPVAKPKLESLSVLADRHRIPAWHQAALLRYMGWQDDKMVTDEAYRKALDELKHRRIGGGRK